MQPTTCCMRHHRLTYGSYNLRPHTGFCRRVHGPAFHTELTAPVQAGSVSLPADTLGKTIVDLRPHSGHIAQRRLPVQGNIALREAGRGAPSLTPCCTPDLAAQNENP